MSARLFGAALGLGPRSGSRAEKADEQPAARMATPRLRIVRPAPPEAAQDPAPRRAGLATRREPHARESRDSPIDRLPESSSRLRVTRPEAASQEAAETTTAVPEEPGRDPYVAAQSGRVARTASREPRADPAPAASQAAALLSGGKPEIGRGGLRRREQIPQEVKSKFDQLLRVEK